MDDKDDSTDLECRATRVSRIASIFKSVFFLLFPFPSGNCSFVLFLLLFYFFHPLNRRIASGVNDVIFLSLATSNTLKVFFILRGKLAVKPKLLWTLKTELRYSCDTKSPTPFLHPKLTAAHSFSSGFSFSKAKISNTCLMTPFTKPFKDRHPISPSKMPAWMWENENTQESQLGEPNGWALDTWKSK